MPTQVDDLPRYLERYGWTFEPAEPNTWNTGWQGNNRSYPMTIKFTDTWIGFSVTPLLKIGADWNSWPELSKYLLELNHDCRLIKIGIDEFGEISLNLQIFTDSLNYDRFSDALGVIGHYAENLYDEILKFLKNTGYFLNDSSSYLT